MLLADVINIINSVQSVHHEDLITLELRFPAICEVTVGATLSSQASLLDILSFSFGFFIANIILLY